MIMTGWSPAKKTVSSDYGDPGNPDLHAAWVAGITYDGLDLSFLYLKRTTGAPESVPSAGKAA